MKIQGRKNQPINMMGPISVSTPPEAPPAIEIKSTESDNVKLTSHPIGKLSEMVNAMPTVRAEKVENLRGAIEEGNYYVESDKLARKVVDEVLTEALLQRETPKER